MLQQIGIIIAAAFGFVLSAYIWRKQMAGEKLVCFLGNDCNKVMNSRYATTFGISNEILGMLYYGAILIAYSSIVFGVVPLSQDLLFVVTGVAAFFSVYLVSVQLFILKEWCEWCLASAVTSIIIFIFTVI